MTKRALITGITGQDGTYLARLLIEKGYEVNGTVRHDAPPNLWRLQEFGLIDQVRIVPINLLDFDDVVGVVDQVQPDELYNLAALSSVAHSFEQPLLAGEVSGLGTARLLEAIRKVNSRIRFYQASTSEMFGNSGEIPHSEITHFDSRSPYAAAKVFAHAFTLNYREAFGIPATSGILFNHESPLRGLEYVTRKITAGLALIRGGYQEVLELGNVGARRDWGFAGDYARGMWMMLQQEECDTFVLATGQSRTVRDFAGTAAALAGLDVAWDGEGARTIGTDRRTNRVIVRVDPALYRPTDIDLVLGDASRARDNLGWEPEVSFEEMIEMMVRSDMDRVAKGSLRTLAA